MRHFIQTGKSGLLPGHAQASLNAALPWRYEARIKTVQTLTLLNNVNNTVARSKMTDVAAMQMVV